MGEVPVNSTSTAKTNRRQIAWGIGSWRISRFDPAPMAIGKGILLGLLGTCLLWNLWEVGLWLRKRFCPWLCYWLDHSDEQDDLAERELQMAEESRKQFEEESRKLFPMPVILGVKTVKQGFHTLDPELDKETTIA